MTAIERFFCTSQMTIKASPWHWPPGASAQTCWQTWAIESRAWLQAQGADPRDALIVLPVGAVLSQARQAWTSAVGGWLPRIDTIASLAEGLSWSWAPDGGAKGGLLALTLDAVVDRLQAAKSLGGEAWAKQWAQRDRRGFEFALDQVVESAQTWVRRMQSIAPGAREAYLAKAREALGGGAAQEPGGRERLLLAWALEWAAVTVAGGLSCDPLYEMRPSALVVVTAGEAVSPGTEIHLTLGVMTHLAEQGVPVCWRSALAGADVSAKVGQFIGQVESQFDDARAPLLRGCAHAEDEALQAAAQVIAAVNVARQSDTPLPVALIALDRGVIRRVRAMLEGAGVQVADETGWLLSTTRAAAVVTRLLQASHPRAATDDLLDWLKSGWLDWPVGEGEYERPQALAMSDAVGALEAWCRRHGMLGAWGLQVPPNPSSDELLETSSAQLVPTGRQAMPPQAVRVWHWAVQVVAPLQRLWSAKRPSLQDWLAALREALVGGGAWSTLNADAAGELAMQSLRFEALDVASVTEGSGLWAGLSSQTRLDGPAFLRWVSAVLEATTFRPPAPSQSPDVVITPLARAVLRPFHAIVLPGADERQLGAMGSQSGWLSTRLREAMDLPTPTTQRAAQWDAFSLVMSRPGVICLYRRAEGSEPIEPSAWLARWAALSGVPIGEAADARQVHHVVSSPVLTPAPSLRDESWALPEQVTATSYEALRQCPYRFFATSVLGLREHDELEEGLDRSDFGVWLHEVLRCFHLERQNQLAISTEEEDVQAWLATAARVVRDTGLDRDSQRPYFLPFQADLDRMARAYVSWLRAHEDEGWTMQDAERVEQRDLPVAPGLSVRLHGQLDRIDARHRDGSKTHLVLDYKTGSLDGLKRKIAAPLEDTQLAFYAALSDPQWTVEAAYLHMDVSEVRQLDHPEVMRSAQVLLEGLSKDWIRLHAGEPMLALGEGSACIYCQARGLCRKDHWTQASAQTSGQGAQA
ncbi:MAG: PD-(D/E)XK nuclease family protein [Burkholderiales bacterium]|nr:MAG: PD-(D/E)XK nuclease family protein [Burkholderiales bacterium]